MSKNQAIVNLRKGRYLAESSIQREILEYKVQAELCLRRLKIHQGRRKKLELESLVRMNANHVEQLKPCVFNFLSTMTRPFLCYSFIACEVKGLHGPCHQTIQGLLEVTATELEDKWKYITRHKGIASFRP